MVTVMNISRYALIVDGIVVNIVLWDGKSDWHPPKGNICIKIDEDTFVSEGFKYSESSGFIA